MTLLLLLLIMLHPKSKLWQIKCYLCVVLAGKKVSTKMNNRY